MHHLLPLLAAPLIVEATFAVAGVIISALAYAWSNATRIRATIEDDENGARIYRVEGPLFFGSAAGFLELFDVKSDPDVVIVDFMKSRVADQSALQAIEALAGRYQAKGIRLELRHLSRLPLAACARGAVDGRFRR